jgi:hypothetical protein
VLGEIVGLTLIHPTPKSFRVDTDDWPTSHHPLLPPPRRPLTGYSAQIQSQNEEKTPPLTQTVPAPTDENLTHTITQTPSDVQSRRSAAMINTCHDARFAPHVGANVNAGCTAMVLKNTCRKCPENQRCPRTSLPQCAFHPTDHVQQDIHPTDNQPPSAGAVPVVV